MSRTSPVDLEIQQLRPEWPKFKAEIVLVAGLWCPASIWRPMMGYLAHRGWECTALAFHPAPGAGWQDHLDALHAHLATLETPPILVGHDSGAALALASDALARIAVAPLLADTVAAHPALVGWRLRLAAWRNQLVAPPVGPAAESVFGQSIPVAPRAESPTLAMELLQRIPQTAFRSKAPTLLLSGTADPITPADRIARLAGLLAADAIELRTESHGLPWASGWDHAAGEIHRWLIRTCGEPLLAMLDEEH